jgi:uncharacterized membrane protein YciS (DUF1049 family)
MNGLTKPRVQWWVMALILSAAWFVLVVGIGYIHTEVILAGKTTDAQDAALSEMYGVVFGFGLPILWVLCFLLARRSE